MDSLRKGEVVVPCGIRGVGSNFATLHLCNVVKRMERKGWYKAIKYGMFIVFPHWQSFIEFHAHFSQR